MLNVDQENSSFYVSEKGIYSSAVGRWRTLLTGEEVYILQKVAGRELLELGYESSKVEVKLLKIAYMYATFLYGLWKALHANRALRGPLLPYVFKRLTSISAVRCRMIVS
jgi:hypothetical protein